MERHDLVAAAVDQPEAAGPPEPEAIAGPDDAGGDDADLPVDNQDIDDRANVLNQPQMHPLGPSDAGRMELSQDERRWARTVKEAIEKDSEITNLSDFWYVQLALIEKGQDIDNVLDRARHLQAFRQEYGITETTSRGCFFVREFIKLLPGFSLSFSFNYATGHYVKVIDVAKFYNAKLLSTPGAVETWLAAIYYLQNGLNPDFCAIRNGAFLLMECDGFDWKTNLNLRLFTKLFQEMASAYPMLWHSVNCFNSGVCLNVLMSMVKRISPPEFHRNYEFGCATELGRLDTLYLTPNMEVANRRILGKLTVALERRYANEAAFSL
ncbi:expressed unknown protein [Seminavis robusta]|uniref:Uncharacterized protein n=1 Tax=Seminavis robusta TaxID=568900 RepID=A0A9N8EBM7_9STRA|nr:expressed unknown protein [Seminavis robusta]|eukprot:Sro849_g210540.1 n/a (324) ;mRNA; r:18960-19931